MCGLRPPPYTFQYQAKYNSPWTCTYQQQQQRLQLQPNIFRRQ